MTEGKKGMDAETQVRSKLLNHYNSKNQAHIKNIYSLIASILGILLSGSIDRLSDPYVFSILEGIIISIPPIFYFFVRARYWSAMAWSIMFVKPKELDYSEDSIYKDNLYGQLNYACNSRIENEEIMVFGFFKLRWMSGNKFKYKIFILTVLLIVYSILMHASA